MDKSIVLTRLHVLITHHIWLVFEKYAAPGAELITSLLDNLVKINNLYRLTICHNPVADIQKKRNYRKIHTRATSATRILLWRPYCTQT